jgi:hypothetical protein
MANIIIRVELKGTPSQETYTSLHAFMSNRGWSQQIIAEGNRPMALPHAMYSGSSQTAIVTLAAALRDEIQSQIWTKAMVLAIEWNNWGLATP